jgi:hypothetical protein
MIHQCSNNIVVNIFCVVCVNSLVIVVMLFGLGMWGMVMWVLMYFGIDWSGGWWCYVWWAYL